jgi:ectoine hydroxylase-related dioxygenase (phytanoyl-CoA dioxygenase family)
VVLRPPRLYPAQRRGARGGYPPDQISIHDGPPTVVNLPVAAGDCVVFTEALYHGALAWTEAYPRMTVFNRYIGDGSHSSLPVEEYKHPIPDELYELEQPAVPGQRKDLVERILRDLATDAADR